MLHDFGGEMILDQLELLLLVFLAYANDSQLTDTIYPLFRP